MRLYVFDLDGTLADDSHRKEHICYKDGSPKKNKDWDRFFDLCSKDKPIESSINVLTSLAKDKNNEIIILTGRNSVVRDKTLAWLDEHIGNVGEGEIISELLMRGAADRMDDHLLKPNMLKKYLKSRGLSARDVVCIFEDRTRVVDAWRINGFNCYQVARGDF